MIETPPRRPLQPVEIAALILGLVTIIGCVLANLRSTVVVPWWSYAIWMAALTAAINLGVSFESGDANFGSIVITASFLALGLAPAVLITLTGVLLGEVLRHLIPEPLGFTPQGWRHAWITASSNLSLHGLSLLAGGTLYMASGGPIPIVNVGQAQWIPVNFGRDLIPLLALFGGYLFTNYLIFAVYHRLEGEHVRDYIRRHWRTIVVLEVLPIFFAILIASAYLNTPPLVFASFAVFMIVVMALIHSLSRARARLEQRVRELNSLSVLGQAVANSLELPEVLEAVYQQTRQLMDAAYFYIALYNGDDGQLVFPLAYENGVRTRYDSRTYGSGLTEHVIATRQPLLMPRHVRATLDQLGIVATGPLAQSWLGMPIVFGDEVLGIIAVQNLEQPDRYTTAHRDILVAIAAQAAAAIHNAQSYIAARHHTTNLAILNSVSMAINSTLDLSRVLDIIVTSVGRVMGNQKAAIFLADEAGQVVSLAASHNLSPYYVTHSRALPIDPNGRAVVVLTRQPLIVDDVRADPRVAGFRATAEAEGFRAFADVPLQTHAQAIGGLTVYYTDAHRFTLTETDLLNTFANQAAIAVVNAKRYGRTDEALTRRIDQLAALEQLGRDLSASLDFDQVIRRVLDRAMAATGAKYGLLGLWHPDRQIIRVTVGQGYRDDPARTIIGTDWPVTQGLVGRAVRSGQLQRVSDVRQDPDYVAVDNTVRSELVVLIRQDDRILGVINLESAEIDRFDPAAADFVSQLATQAAIALHNAQLYRDVAAGRDQVQAILNSSHDGILMFDRDSRILLVNPELEKMWRLSRSDLEGHTLLEMLDQPDKQLAAKLGLPPATVWTTLQPLRAAQYLDWPKDVFALPRHAPGDHEHAERYIERACLPVHDARQQAIGWMLVLRDVTEERELQQLRDDLTNTIVHDLRSPLTSILGGLHMLKEMVTPDRPDSDESQALSISIHSANQLLNLVNSLLDISKLKAGQPLADLHAASLVVLIDTAIIPLAPLAQEVGIVIRRQTTSDLPLVLVDEDKIGRVLTNLLDNALKFTPVGGQITVLAERWAVNPAFVRCTVRDTGPGIPVEFRTRIFERFVQLPEQTGRRRGSGLGLSFCRLAIEAHGGQIWIADAPSSGSEFSFTVRAAEE